MTLADLVFRLLLPRWMRDDLAVSGLASGVDALTRAMAQGAGLNTTWDKIDEMSEAELDELAWELNILWYDTGADIETKRALVKDSDKVFKRLGTKWAVENVISAYFGDGYIREWFEYDGDPGYFRVFSSNPTITNENLNEFLNILNKVKRLSAHLEGIFITLTGEMHLHTGVQLHEVSRETYSIGATAPETGG